MIGIEQRSRPALVVVFLLGIAMLTGCGGNSAAEAPDSNADFRRGPTGAALVSVNGGGASGSALVLRRTPSSPAQFKVTLRGLEPNTDGGQYVVWLATSRHDMVPLYSYRVGKSGVFAHRWTPNPLHVGFIEEGKKTKFVVTLARNAAEKEKTMGSGGALYDPPFIGEPVVEGEITGPLMGGDSAE